MYCSHVNIQIYLFHRPKKEEKKVLFVIIIVAPEKRGKILENIYL